METGKEKRWGRRRRPGSPSPSTSDPTLGISVYGIWNDECFSTAAALSTGSTRDNLSPRGKVDSPMDLLVFVWRIFRL